MANYNEDVEVNEIRIGKIDDGQKYLTSIFQDGVADDGNIDLYFEDPIGGVEESFVVVDFSPGAKAEAIIAEDVSQDGSGSETTVMNAKPNVGDTANSITRTGDVYTINGSQLSIFVPGGTVAGASAGGGSNGTLAPTTFLVEPDNSMLFRLFNRSGGSAGLGIVCTWFEVDI